MTARGEELGMLTRILGAIDEYVYVGEFLPDGVYRLAFQGPCRAGFLGLDEVAAQSAVWEDHVHPADREHFGRTHREARRTGSLDTEYRLLGADGVTRWVRDRGRVRLEEGRSFLYGSVLDVTAIHAVQEQLEATVAQLERLGREDPLTGLANRRMLPEVLDRRLARETTAVGILLLDVDHFKHINDLHGHATGDEVLVEVAARIRRTVRTGDIVARVGGEEFLVLLGGVADEEVLRRIGEAIRLAVGSADVVAYGCSLRVTASLGAALSAGQHRTHESLMTVADRALYAAKRAGRNRLVLAGDHPDPPGSSARTVRGRLATLRHDVGAAFAAFAR